MAFSHAFVYSRRGPDSSYKDSYKISRIKEFGDVWKKRLAELMNQEGSLRGMAKELHVDPQTVKRQAALLGLDFSWNGEPREEAIKKVRFQAGVENSGEDGSALQAKKEEWIILQNQNPTLSKTELRSLAPALYAWLYRHDRDWLNVNSPKVKKKASINKRVDWKRRDRELLEQLKNVIAAWDKDCLKPKRITISSVARKINKVSLFEKKKAKLPLSMDYLNSVVETVTDFQIRRVKFTAANMVLMYIKVEN